MVAVTAIFEKSLKEVEVLQQQIVLKQQLIADLDAEAVVQAPRVAQLPTMGGEVAEVDSASAGASAPRGALTGWHARRAKPGRPQLQQLRM